MRLTVLLGVLLVTTSVFAAQEPQVSRPGNGVSAPRLVKEVKPNYPEAARRDKIQGTVLLSTVVLDDGTVGDVKVVRSLGDPKHGFDAEAIKAAKQWIFTPGLKDGKPVPVQVSIELYFHP